MGGRFSNTTLDEIIRERISIEDVMSAAPLRINNMRELPSVKNAIKIKKSAKESDKEFWKRRNAIYSKGVFQRRENELVTLQHQKQYLGKRKNVLEGDNERLEALLAQARGLLGALGLPSLLRGKITARIFLARKITGFNIIHNI